MHSHKLHHQIDHTIEATYLNKIPFDSDSNSASELNSNPNSIRGLRPIAAICARSSIELLAQIAAAAAAPPPRDVPAQNHNHITAKIIVPFGRRPKSVGANLNSATHIVSDRAEAEAEADVAAKATAARESTDESYPTAHLAAAQTQRSEGRRSAEAIMRARAGTMALIVRPICLFGARAIKSNARAHIGLEIYSELTCATTNAAARAARMASAATSRGANRMRTTSTFPVRRRRSGLPHWPRAKPIKRAIKLEGQ